MGLHVRLELQVIVVVEIKQPHAAKIINDNPMVTVVCDMASPQLSNRRKCERAERPVPKAIPTP